MSAVYNAQVFFLFGWCHLNVNYAALIITQIWIDDPNKMNKFHAQGLEMLISLPIYVFL